MIQCISNARETNHSPQCQLPTGKSRCYISILTRNAFVHNCTMHNALHHCTISQLHNFNAQHDFNARQIVLWKRLVMPFVANIWCWMWGCEDDLRLTSSSMIMLQHARRDPSLSNHQSTPHPNPNQPCHHLLMTNLHDHTHLTYGPTKQNTPKQLHLPSYPPLPSSILPLGWH